MKYERIEAQAYQPMRQQAGVRKQWPAGTASALCLLMALPILFQLPITHDAIWQIWIGRKMLEGATLYVDIIEVNPPLWFWIAVPLAAIGKALAIDARVLTIGFFVSVIAVSLLLIPNRYRLLSLVAMLVLPLHDWAQREHFTLIATLPYVFMMAGRVSGESPRHPVPIALFAAVGFALKPHFALVPLALELMIWKQPRIRPETIVLALGAASYAIGVAIWAPAFLTDTIPMVRQAYGSFRGSNIYFPVVTSFVLAAYAAWAGKRKGDAVTRALFIAAVAFLPAFLLQGKGWAYHSVPARGLLFMAISLELIRVRKTPLSDGVLMACAFMTFQPMGVYFNKFRVEAEQHVNAMPEGSSIIALVANPSIVWPMVDERKLDWQLREFSIWQLQAAISTAPQMKPVLRKIVHEDLAKRPDFVMFDRRPGHVAHIKALMPKGYLDRCTLLKRTRRLESYRCTPPAPIMEPRRG